jgi:hypothetical protein
MRRSNAYWQADTRERAGRGDNSSDTPIFYELFSETNGAVK